MPVPTATLEKEQVLDLFRRWGYLEADLDPLGFLKPEPHPELNLDDPEAEQARRCYCGTIGAEFMHIPDRGAAPVDSASGWRTRPAAATASASSSA